MYLDLESVLATHGLRAGRRTILVERSGRMVARVDTDQGPVVVKVAPPALIAREVAGNARLRSAGLPVSRVVGTGRQPMAYAVLSWAEGDPLTADSPATAQADAGELLRRVHALGGGPPYAGTVPVWTDWMRGWLNHAAAWWTGIGRADPATVRRLWAWLDHSAQLLDARGTDLMLFDGRPEHFIVADGKVVALIDLSEICGGDGAMDLGVFAVDDPRLLAGVLAGYAPTPKERDVIDAVVPFYTTLRRLARAEWLLTHGDPDAAETILALLATDRCV